MFSQILVEFLFRLTFGVAAAMLITPARWVTSGFFRVHLWVLLGMQTLCALAVCSPLPLTGKAATIVPQQLFALAVAAAILSYFGSVAWMYEQQRLGKLLVGGIAAVSLTAGWWFIQTRSVPADYHVADFVSGGLLLGFVTTAMFLGHWYLNTPTMKLEPLKRLIVLLALAVLLRMAVCIGGTWLAITVPLSSTGMPVQTWVIFLSLRWLTGLAGVLLLAWMTWQTLRIPNTQSATGILYAALILAFIGELTSQLLTAQVRYPV